MKDFLMYIGNDPESGWYQKKGKRDPSLIGCEALAAFCEGKSVTRVWRGNKAYDEHQDFAMFFDDGSIFEISFVEGDSRELAAIFYYGLLPDEVAEINA